MAHEAAELEAHPPEVKTKKDFAALDRHKVRTQLWVSMPDPGPAGDNLAKAARVAQQLRGVAVEAGKRGHKARGEDLADAAIFIFGNEHVAEGVGGNADRAVKRGRRAHAVHKGGASAACNGGHRARGGNTAHPMAPPISHKYA
jgi:hypothetical protein